MALKVLIHSQPHLFEKETCLQQHLESLALESSLITIHSPKIVLEELQTFALPLFVIDPSLRFLVNPEHISQRDCDIAFFLNEPNKVDADFLCFHPTQKTFALLEQWVQKGFTLIEGIESTLQTNAQSARFLRLSNVLKISEIQDETPFHRWFLKV